MGLKNNTESHGHVTGYGNGYGDGYGYGYGDGSGYGYGNGYGDGYGDGYGNGNGYGNGYGDGYGYGDGDGYGYGNGDGDGYGYGNGYGDGYGYGNGYGYGDGDGNGNYWFQSIVTKLDGHERSEKLCAEGAALAYWRSNSDGTPSNGGKGTKAKVGLIEEIEGPLEICTARALHATLSPEKWKGSKIWIVAIYPPFVVQVDKIGGLKREFIAEADFNL